MRKIFVLLGVILLLIPALTLTAQEDTGDDNAASADEVNEIASKMYCPVCENIPLDSCATAACQDWREEIRLMLNDGMDEEQIVDDFIMRFGEQVVGTPKDPLLNALSLWVPWMVVIAGSFGIGRWLWMRSQSKRTHLLDQVVTEPVHPAAEDDLYAQLEHDVKGR